MVFALPTDLSRISRRPFPMISGDLLVNPTTQEGGERDGGEGAPVGQELATGQVGPPQVMSPGII